MAAEHKDGAEANVLGLREGYGLEWDSMSHVRMQERMEPSTGEMRARGVMESDNVIGKVMAWRSKRPSRIWRRRRARRKDASS